MTDITRYQTSWDRYWGETQELMKTAPDQARSLWENDWKYAAERDLPRLKQYMKPDLPLIDFGCGNGRQTKFFAPHFKKVVGTDIAAPAIALAKEHYSAPNIEYRVLDGFDSAGAERLHAELGDANIYMRTVLHQVALEDRELFVRNVKTLLGTKGSLYLYELSTTAEAYMRSFVNQHGMIDKLERILRTGMSPGPVGRSDLETLFAPEFKVLVDGEEHEFGGYGFLRGQNGEPLNYAPPTYYAVLQRDPKSVQ